MEYNTTTNAAQPAQQQQFAQAQQPQQAQTNNTPVFVAKVGRVEVAVFRSSSADGRHHWYSSKPSSSYKDKEGNWKNTSYIENRDGLLSLIQAATDAERFIAAQGHP